jgi:hypothetical protein
MGGKGVEVMEVLRTLVCTQIVNRQGIADALDGIVDRLHHYYASSSNTMATDFGLANFITLNCAYWLFRPKRGWIYMGNRKWKY